MSEGHIVKLGDISDLLALGLQPDVGSAIVIVSGPFKGYTGRILGKARRRSGLILDVKMDGLPAGFEDFIDDIWTTRETEIRALSILEELALIGDGPKQLLV